MSYSIGIDIGSTTVKVVVLNEKQDIVFQSYQRHFSRVREKTSEVLASIADTYNGEEVHIAVTGSAGLGVAKACGLEFVQEVFATAGAVERYLPETDAVIELGGEDAKIIFLTGGLEERMNGSCAGGTGAFIDQMATLLGVRTEDMDALAAKHEKIYAIASRCGVFAKSDIQPLLNQGARREDIAASVFQAVVEQTVAGLAQGRKIEGRVAFLGGPLSFFSTLRERFVKTLHLSPENALFPKEAAYFVALGAALYAQKFDVMPFDLLLKKLQTAKSLRSTTHVLEPLFRSQAEYAQFAERHSTSKVEEADLSAYRGKAYLGIDAGSTTLKVALITGKGELLYSFYAPSRGNTVDIVKAQLEKIYDLCGDRVRIAGSAVTGYGEDLIRSAFGVDFGLVETVAHFYAARHFEPQVDFILDIGGQDVKCFKIRGGAVDSIMLNEACSSGCGSFIETFAMALGYTVADFAKLGLFAEHPVDLGSRCTVFMNSSVKQAQKDGAGVDDISAGISMSVVKNALYKVIRAADAKSLGSHIVVQGGTFYNDAVLRAFEKEMGLEVTRPAISGLMGAYGAALFAQEQGSGVSNLLSAEALSAFTHETRTATCGLCTNHCTLTINVFDNGRRFISGNRCDRPTGHKTVEELPDMFQYKYDKLMSYQPVAGPRGKIGLPMVLNMYENLPFWHTLLTELEFEVVRSPASSRALYTQGQYTIPSDTVCYPAKLVHGHMEALLDAGVDTIFYPCMSYNFDESRSDNHYNCPVVAYYPELIAANVDRLHSVRYLTPYFGLDRPRDFKKRAAAFFKKEFDVPERETRKAVDAAYAAYRDYEDDIKAYGARALDFARAHGKYVIVLAGRPYHVDPEINHGINRLISSYGLVIVTEDAVADYVEAPRVKVLNQWTYHARLYAAAKYVTTRPEAQLVQLVSFGCGIDAITTDEVRSICEEGSKLYTQIKIDEIDNLGAVKIRIRSLLAAMESRNKEKNYG
ncbi:acyl-CoA dehydratase activase-related protein [Ethanoligenens harbinense]|uniref:CoA-substrate-specific enzyme activase n=1 Tax=Ethanoligenens harbinense (strain DSM 18485 / JCM 12961 / CGMCC 1.5033 / YUAN-3) TaxID=663278 RepID=E6U6W0_ETHHY|nr:acyl-CoA dehydratase activase-related protein [Ethanoligenens harbinense]ADU26927.1 CoA-substrate-specific enzyme activase [Ethanoligenens harbinense YUAN-3]AVQ96021.1 2-hydroxyglutaryl-CoA dehydratase [Ethanoligenens harbinense YUAN-3]AYF38682.1 2-hydroxyglutaryl-CoA dehydratase [Ethanoligenens harbinense]AYF41429.1 2-hydroxyglutaryl-CoA dehydratase [Ethanoligenens harbinense]QCN92263.1 2-hydroxyglutaryl-CoA dehydratase [Ethanoligenens harbinense]